MKLFITGGQGMVGRNLSVLAKQYGFSVVAPARSELDLINYVAIRSALMSAKPDLVVHAAGLVGGIQRIW